MNNDLELSPAEIRSRHSVVRELLKPLRPGGKELGAFVPPRAVAGGKVLFAHDGTPPGDHRSAYFRTSAQVVRGQYFEIWMPLPGGPERLLLQRAYLNVFKVNEETRSSEELLAVHCDPWISEGDESYRFKRGPHLHVSCADAPIRKCHFPLELGQLESVLSSLDALTDAFRRAVSVVAAEVLPRF